MATVHVPVLKPLIYQGRSYVRGDSIRMDAAEAAARARRGEVSLTKGVTVTRELSAEPATSPRPRARRSYRRRDMNAESRTSE